MPTRADVAVREAAHDQSWERIYAAGRRAVGWPAAAAPAFARGRAADDALAAWRRWHGPDADSRFSPAEWPWYALMERARVETLASADLPGLMRNLAPLGPLLPAGEGARVLYRMAREVLGGCTCEPGANASMPAIPVAPPGAVRPWWPWRRQAPALPPAVPDHAELLRVLVAAEAVMHDGARFVEVVEPLVRTLAACYEASPGLVLAPGEGTLASTAEGDVESPDAEDSAPHEVAGRSTSGPDSQGRSRDAGYAIYSTAWDEVVDASTLVAADEPAPSALTDQQRRQVMHLAQRLQRRLLAARQSRWSFDEETGLLDNRRLSRLVTPGGDRAVFRQERATPVPEACVTLLVDQSGSMRGERQRIVALAVAFATQTLERCRIPCEVLGYTTRFGAENPVVDAWRAAGSPPRPGRLNALRHIVYKAASHPWPRARNSMRLLLREGFGKENVDGEALAWAARRLAARPEPRKILIVLCDGVPHDAATVGAMGRAFLENHLRAVIREVEGATIHLAAFGAGSDVGRFYRHAVVLRDTDTVAQMLFDHLGDVLTSVPTSAMRPR